MCESFLELYSLLRILICWHLCSNISCFILYRLYHINEFFTAPGSFNLEYFEILGWWSHSARSVRLPSWIRRVWHRFPWHYCRCWRTAVRYSSAKLWMGCRKETFTHAAGISKQCWHFAWKREKIGSQVRTKTKLEGTGISRANTSEVTVNVWKGSPWTKITPCSLVLKRRKRHA